MSGGSLSFRDNGSNVARSWGKQVIGRVTAVNASIGGMVDTTTVGTLIHEIRRFSEERDWDQFHDPKSLLLALVGEVGELAELFQWVSADQARALFSEGERRRRAAEEIADVATYLIRLADTLGIDLAAAVLDKLAASRKKYPAEEYAGEAPTKS